MTSIEELAKSFSESLSLIQDLKKQLDEIKNEISPEIKRMSDESRSRFEMFEKKTQDILQEMEQGAAKFDYNCRTVLESIAQHEKEFNKNFEISIRSLAKYEKELNTKYKLATEALIKHEKELDHKYESAIQTLTKRINGLDHIAVSENEQNNVNTQLDNKSINELMDLRNKMDHNVVEKKFSTPPETTNTIIEEQIKPVDWAREHGIKVDLVMKLLRDAGVTVRTQVSKISTLDYMKIEGMAAKEKRRHDTSG